MSHLQQAIIYFENGVSFKGRSFGTSGTTSGEIIFNTSLSGYQEITTDPSYAGQIITFCMPEIGNVGANDDDTESENIYANGVIVRNYNETFSNFRAKESLADFLKRHNKIGICDVNTREIVKMLRKEGALMAVISTEIFDTTQLQKYLDETPPISEVNFNDEVSTKSPFTHSQGVWDPQSFSYDKTPDTTKNIVAIDFGIKQNILNELTSVGLNVKVINWDFNAQELIDLFDQKQIGGIFLSNGPGDPKVMKDYLMKEVKALIDHNIPIFGICFGHQLLSMAFGFDTYKLKFGHHGANHPVKNVDGKVEITSQNHIYSIPEEITQVADVIATNLFDGTIQGVKYKDKPIFSVQYHPESNPGPQDSKSYFQSFADMVIKH